MSSLTLSPNVPGTLTPATVTPGGLSMAANQLANATLTSYPYLVHQIPISPDGGAADQWAAIQTFITAQTPKTIVALAAGTYRVSADIVMPNGVSFAGAGAERTTILFDDVAGNGLTWAGPSWDVSNTLASNAATDATTVTVTSNGNQYTAGMWVYITDTDSATIGAPFVTRVVSVSTNTITLQDALPQDYTTAHTATLYGSTVGLWSGMSVQGIGFGVTSKAYGTNATARNSFLKISGCKNFLIADCLFDGAFSEGVWVNNLSHGVKIRDSRFTGCVGDGNGSYGLVVTDSTRVSVTGSEFEHCGNGISFEHSPYPLISNNQVRYCTTRGIKFLWGCGFAVVNNNQVSDVVLSGIHNDNSMGSVISGNTLHNTASSSGNYAINLSQDATALTYPGTIVSNNTIRKCESGIYVGVRFQYARVVGNDIGYTTNVGAMVYVQASDVSIVGNGIHDGVAGTTGIYVTPDSAQGADRALVTGNHIQGTVVAIDTQNGGGSVSAARGALVTGNFGGSFAPGTHDTYADNV